MEKRESSTARGGSFIDVLHRRVAPTLLSLLTLVSAAEAEPYSVPVVDSRPIAEISLTITASEFKDMDPGIRANLEDLVLASLVCRLASAYGYVRWVWRRVGAPPASRYQLALRIRDEQKIGVVVDFAAAVDAKAKMSSVNLEGTPDRIYRETDYKPVFQAATMAKAIIEKLDFFFKSEPFLTAVHSDYLLAVPVAADVLPTATGIIVPNVLLDHLQAKSTSTLQVRFSAWSTENEKVPKDGIVNISSLSKVQRGIEGQITWAEYDKQPLTMAIGTCSKRLRGLLLAPLRQSVVVVMENFKKKSPFAVDANGLSTTRIEEKICAEP